MEAQDLTGRVLDGKYRLERKVAQGGFGAVYRAVQLPLGRPVAVKVGRRLHDAAMQARFKREAQVLAALVHPNVVQLIDYGESTLPDLGSVFYLVQPFIEGESLSAHLKRVGPLPIRQIEWIMDQVLPALAEAHRAGIVHRDIKPANIMIDTRGSGPGAVRVLDFGIAKLVDAEVDDGPVTRTGVPLGTPAYMAPEQCRGLAVGPATDVYAAGVMLHELLTGARPFRGATPVDVMSLHLSQPPPALPPEVPAELEAVIHQAMAKAPADRYPDAEAFHHAFRQALARSDAPPPPRKSARSPWLPLVALIALGALGAGLAFAWAATRVHEPAPDAEPPSVMVIGGAPDADHVVDAAPPPVDAAPADQAPPVDAAPSKQTPPVRPTPGRRRRGSASPRSAPPPAPPPAAPSATVEAETFRRELKACHCARASAALSRLRALDPVTAAVLANRYEEECQVHLEGNCRSRQ
ncbi:MAG: serine/threonine protein kinase [Myxococcales bacterium]|nr:serine/threonine protein kinase [Myxococcales bacterium]